MTASKSPAKIVMQSDIAQALNVCQATVSLALRNSPAISKARREQIQEVARKMGYRPNPIASALAHTKKHKRQGEFRESLAWLNFWPDPKQLRSWGEFDRYWLAAKACAEKHGYRLEEFVARGLTLHRLEQQLRARGIKGILVPPHGGLPLDLKAFGWEHFSVVRFGSAIADPAAHCVDGDVVANVICALNSMQARGYRRIGFVGYQPGKRLTLHAYLGQQQLMPAEDRIPPFAMAGNVEQVSHFEPAFIDWLQRYKPDAILTEVEHVPAMLSRAGWRVPQDVALASTTVLDIPQIDAGIDQNALEIGRVAVLVLISLLRDNDQGIPPIHREIRIKGKWVDGRSLPECSGPAVDPSRSLE